jgi:probable rRNA maturation factor
MSNKIKFYYQYKNFILLSKQPLKKYISKIFKLEHIDFQEVTIVFCDDKYLLNLNATFLKHNFYTDILTFILSANTESLVGEIYISIERVKENARKFSIPFKQELHRVIFHGILHLCNYNDDTRAAKQLMSKKEDLYLHKYFNNVSRGTFPLP